MAGNDLSRQRLPRRPTNDYGDDPSALDPLPEELATSPGRVYLHAGDASQGEDVDVPFDHHCGITRADLWIAVASSTALAVIVSELLHVLGLFSR